MSRWAQVEVMGHRSHVGVISEETWAGGVWLRVAELKRDGSFLVHRYAPTAVFGFREMPEEEARRAVLPQAWRPCDTFQASVVLPSACEHCAFTEEKHVKPAQLPPPREPDDDDEEEEDDDRIVEREPATAGWAVFSGCGGEGPSLVAFFAGSRGKALAKDLLEQRDPDGDLVIFDGNVAPAALVADRQGGLFVANHHDDEIGIHELSRACGISSEDWDASTPSDDEETEESEGKEAQLS